MANRINLGRVQGTTFTPSVDQEGNLSWSNDDGLENPPSVNIKGKDGADGVNGTNGAIFTPTVDQEGNLSWSNDGGLENPETVNVRGPGVIIKTSDEWENENPVLPIGSFGYDSTNKILKIGDGITKWNGISNLVTEEKPTFARSPWSKIAEISESGQAEKFFNIGDEREILLSNGYKMTIRIIGFNHDDLCYGGKAGITIDTKHAFDKEYPFSPEDISPTKGWEESYMRLTVMDELMRLLPIDLQSVIKVVNKKTKIKNDGSVVTTKDKLFILAVAEIFSTTSIQNIKNNEYKSYIDRWLLEGTQYEYYKQTVGDTPTDSRHPEFIRQSVTGRTGSWYLRTNGAIYSSDYAFMGFNFDFRGFIHNVENDVSVAFCI